jgi:radical SAM superfamily enzyme YgiQ (UPF0313 family)
MRVLLIKPTMRIDSQVIPFAAESILPSMGILYLASMLEKNNHQVKVYDQDVEDTPIIDIIDKFNPDYIGITATTPQFPNAIKVANEIKILRNNIIIVIGGTHVTCVGPKILEKYICFDYLLMGEGEFAMTDIVNGKAPETIEGLCYRANGSVVYKTPVYIENLDDLPYPSRHLLDYSKFKDSPIYSRSLKNHGSLLFSRGCLYKCIFCSHKIKGKVRFRTAKNILGEIEILYKQGITDFRILDEFFTMNKIVTREVCEAIISNKWKITWNCQTRADSLDEKTIKLMKKAGCWCIQIGVETGNKDTMKYINKNLDLEKLIEQVKMIRKNKIFVVAFFMIGFPGETKQTIQDTIDYSKKLDPDMATFSIVTPYPATDIWTTSGLDELDETTIKNLGFYYNKNYFVKDVDLSMMYSLAVKSFYLRPKIVYRLIKEGVFHGDLGRRYNYIKVLTIMALNTLKKND